MSLGRSDEIVGSESNYRVRNCSEPHRQTSVKLPATAGFLFKYIAPACARTLALALGISPTETNRRLEGGQRAEHVCPGISDIDLFRNCQGVIDLDAEIPDRAFDLGMPEQKLDGPEITGAPIDQRSLRTPERVRPK